MAEEINQSPSRLEGESQEDYKLRRKAIKDATNLFLKGKTVWPSRSMGAYRKDSGIDLNRVLQGDMKGFEKEWIGKEPELDETPTLDVELKEKEGS